MWKLWQWFSSKWLLWRWFSPVWYFWQWFSPVWKLWQWFSDQLWTTHLLELSVVSGLSHSVPQRDLSIAKQTNLIGFDLGAEQDNNMKVQQTFRFPSAVILSLLQLPQNCSDIEVMKPTCFPFDFHSIKSEPDLAQKAWHFPPLRRVIWRILNTLERWKCLPDHLHHFLPVRIHSDKPTHIRKDFTWYETILSVFHRFPSNGIYSMNRTSMLLKCFSYNCVATLMYSLVPGFLDKVDDLVLVQTSHHHTVHLCATIYWVKFDQVISNEHFSAQNLLHIWR